MMSIHSLFLPSTHRGEGLRMRGQLASEEKKKDGTIKVKGLLMIKTRIATPNNGSQRQNTSDKMTHSPFIPLRQGFGGQVPLFIR
jgi:hypothetical protein